MLKYTVLFAAVFCLVQSQRPWHAGSSNRLPQVLPQYIDERIAAERIEATQAEAAQAAQAAQPGQETLGILNQGTQMMGQGAQVNPMGQGAQVNPMGQGAQVNPMGQGAQVIPLSQEAQNQVLPLGSGVPVQGASTIGIGESMLGNRIGAEESAATATPFLSTTITLLPSDLPVDAHGDIDLINRIKTWPRDKQPFWYINWQAIQAHRGDVNNAAQPVQTQPNARSFFAGR